MKIAVGIVGLVFASTFSFAESLTFAELQGEISQNPMAVEINTDVYSVRDQFGSVRVHSFGVNGMKHDLQRLSVVLEQSERAGGGLKSTWDLRNQIDFLSEQIAKYEESGPADHEQSQKASQSGGACNNAIMYSLSADVDQVGFYQFTAEADAAFQQWGGGPPIPGDAVLYTYAEGNWGGGTVTDSDNAIFSPNGFNWVSADTSTVNATAYSCITMEAFASISVSACGSTGYYSVSESDSFFC